MNDELNSLALAYLGDSIYEVYIRTHLIQKGIVKVKELQKEAITYVSARAQAEFLTKFLTQNLLTEEEINVVMRARNHKCNHHPKYTDIITYKYATGLEALFGYLYINKNSQRMEQLIRWIVGA